RRPWRIRRWRFKGLTGDDQTRCAGCGRRRDAVVVGPRWAFVGLTPLAGAESAPPRPLTPDGAFILETAVGRCEVHSVSEISRLGCIRLGRGGAGRGGGVR